MRKLLLALCLLASPAFADLTGPLIPVGSGGGGGGSFTAGGDLSGSDTSQTIVAGAVTLSKMANLAASSFICNNTVSLTAPIACTVAQVKTLLAISSGDVSGLAASATTDTTNATNITSGALADARLSANVPLLNASNVFTGTTQSLTNAEPRQIFVETDQGADLKNWDFDVNGAVFSGRTRTDADAAGKIWLTITRGATTAISSVALGNASDAVSFSFLNNGSGNATFSGPVVAVRYVVTGTTVASNGIYAPGTNILGLSTASTERAFFDANGMFNITNTEPRQTFIQSGAGTDLKNWDFDVASTVLTGRTRTDADGAGKNWLSVTRGTTTAISDVSLGNATDNPTFHWLGSGTATFGGAINIGNGSTATVGNVTFTSSNIASTGFYRPAANTIGMSTASVERASIDASGVLNAGFGVTQAANTSANGLTLADNTVSSSGNQQYSPALDWIGHAWGTTPPADSAVDFTAEVRGVQGTTPTANWVLSGQIGAGGYSDLLTMSTAGTLSTTTGNFSAGISAQRLNVNGSTVVTNGIYLPLASTIGFAANTTQVGTWTTTAFQALNGVLFPGIASSTAAQTGTVCWTTSTGNLTFDPSNTCLVSARRFKDRIAPLGSALDEVLRLNPVSYYLKDDVAAKVDDPNNYAYGEQVGFIAEDVAAVDPRLVTYEADGQLHTVRYMQMTAILAKAIQEQNGLVSSQAKTLSRQQIEIYALAAWCLCLTGFLIARRPAKFKAVSF